MSDYQCVLASVFMYSYKMVFLATQAFIIRYINHTEPQPTHPPTHTHTHTHAQHNTNIIIIIYIQTPTTLVHYIYRRRVVASDSATTMFMLVTR